MAATVNRVLGALGSLLGTLIPSGGGAQPGTIDPYDGPSFFYQGTSFLDPRFSPANKDSQRLAAIPAFVSNPYVVIADGIPQATGGAVIAALANAVNGTPMALTTVDVGGGAAGVLSIAHAMPILPMAGGINNAFPGGGVPVTTAMALDYGFTTGTTNATSTVTVPDSTLFYPGQWIVIGGGGNTAKTLPLITQVKTLASATTITVSPAPASSLTNSAIGSANAYGNYPAQLVANAAQPYVNGGLTGLFNPLEGVCRNVTITGVSGGAGGAFLVTGYDVYGMAMSETITAAAGVATTAGKKAFKYIAAVTPQFDDAHTYSAGIGNLTGFNLRVDRWEYLTARYNGGQLTSVNGFTAAVTTTPSPTTGDVRGTLDVSSASGLNQAFNGTARLTLLYSVPVWNLVAATPVNAVPMFGQTQA